MAVRIVKETKTLSEFPDLDLKTQPLDSVIQEALSRVKRESAEEKKSVKVYVPEKCDLEISDNDVSIHVSKGNSIDMEKLLKEVTLLLQQRHNLSEFNSQMAISIRHGKHSVQFISGHLKRNDKEELLPMHEVLNHRDQTMIRTLKTLKSYEIKSTLSNELDSYSLQDSNIAMGFLKEAKEAILEGGPRKEAAQKFGFKIMAKKSEGVVPNGMEGQTCIAERLCVYAEEYNSEDVANKVIETYRMAQKVRNNPPVIMGLKNEIEIHADKKIISLSRKHSDSKTFSEFLTKLFEIVGVTDVSALTFEYQKEVVVEDTPFQKWLAAQAKHAERILNWTEDNKHNINFSLLSISILLLFAFLLRINTLFEATMIMVPSLVVIAAALLFSGKDKIVRKVGQRSVVFAFYASFAIAGILAVISFDEYLLLLKIVAATVAVFIAWIFIAAETEEKRDEAIRKLKEWLAKTAKNLEIKINAFGKKALANKAFVSTLTAFLVVVGIALTIMIGVVMVPVIIFMALFIPIVIMLDRQFWQEIEADRERTLDKFFEDFRAKREDLPEACEVRFEITKCKKLRNPFRGIPTKLAKYAKNKYPKSLTLNGFKQTAQKLITGKWAEKTLRGEQ
ncbi:MAG: hypothetical protein Q8O89_01270 [Nanoarchaeota archaeon]|nr:hypothetical protein [Nanoarchaeota archaeon]